MALISFPPPKPERRPLTPRDIKPTAFEQLLPFSWRDHDYPTSDISFSFQQDLAEHKYWGVDGARVEATGRGPIKITIKIPFFNGIAPGKKESWQSGDLYPTALRQFVKDFADRTTGLLQHPEFDLIQCKPQSIDVKHDPLRRDGVEVIATWIETDEDDSGQVIWGESPVQNAKRAAVDLDSDQKDIRDLAPDAPVFEETWDSMINKVSGAIDKVSTTSKLIAGKPGQILHRLDTLGDSISRAKTCLTWPATDAIERMKSALHDIQTAVVKSDRPILRYTTPGRTTVAALTGSLPGSQVGDLIKLNPNLIANPEVPAGTVIRYYAPR